MKIVGTVADYSVGGQVMDWEAISRESLDELVVEGLAKATADERAVFSRAAVTPTKWQLSPWGDLGGGFWVVALMEDRVLWYNDIEDGFNVSQFVASGTIHRPSTGATRMNCDGR